MLRNRKLNRMKGYDYAQDNLYFVTSCVKNMNCVFGTISSGRMILNNYGEIAEQQWDWLKEQYPYIELHEFIVMPNHIHGIIEINRSCLLEPSVQQPIKIKSLSEIMGAYKTTSSKRIHQLQNTHPIPELKPFPMFAWHRSFHDHIIRDEKSFDTISYYILNNPSKWEHDKYYN